MTKKTSLTLGEIEQIEDYADMPITALDDPTVKKAKLFTVIAWIVKKRENPAYTINEAQTLTQDEFAEIMKVTFGAGE